MQLNPWIVGHAISAAALFYGFQRVVLAASHEISLIWSIAGGIGAAVLAWSQSRRDR